MKFKYKKIPTGIVTKDYIVEVLDDGYGYFEYQGDDDEELSGGLWFDGNELVDFDGCGILPTEVQVALLIMGFKLD